MAQKIYYTDPSDSSQKSFTLDPELELAIEDDPNNQELTLVCNLKAKPVGTQEHIRSIKSELSALVHGAWTRAYPEVVEKRLGADYISSGINVTLTMKSSAEAADFADGDAIAVLKNGLVKYAKVSAVNGANLTIDEDLGENFLKNITIVQKLSTVGQSPSDKKVLGLKAQKEQPAAPTNVQATDGGSQTIEVSWTASSDSSESGGVVTHYHIFVRPQSSPMLTHSRFDYPDYVGASGNSQDGVDTYNAGTELEAGNYYVYVVASDAAAWDNANISELSAAASVTVA